MGDQLAALTDLGQALCDVVLGASLDEAHLQVDPLIAKGVHCGLHATLTLVSSHYGGVNFDAVG